MLKNEWKHHFAGFIQPGMGKSSNVTEHNVMNNSLSFSVSELSTCVRIFLDGNGTNVSFKRLLDLISQLKERDDNYSIVYIMMQDLWADMCSLDRVVSHVVESNNSAELMMISNIEVDFRRLEEDMTLLNTKIQVLHDSFESSLSESKVLTLSQVKDLISQIRKQVVIFTANICQLVQPTSPKRIEHSLLKPLYILRPADLELESLIVSQFQVLNVDDYLTESLFLYLHGPRGIGKRSMVERIISRIRDQEILELKKVRIVAVSVRRNPNISSVIAKIRDQMNISLPESSLETVKRRIFDVTRSHKYLICLFDVNQKDLEELRCFGPKSVVLVTTLQPPDTGISMRLNPFSKQQSIKGLVSCLSGIQAADAEDGMIRQLLKVLKSEDVDSKLLKDISVSTCLGNPESIKSVASFLLNHMGQGTQRSRRRINKIGPIVFQPNLRASYLLLVENEYGRPMNVIAVLQRNLDILLQYAGCADDQLVKWKSFIRRCSILPYSTSIPMQIIAFIAASAGLYRNDAKDVIEECYVAGLFDIDVKDGKKFICLHDLQLDFLRNLVGQDETSFYHNDFLQVLRDVWKAWLPSRNYSDEENDQESRKSESGFYFFQCYQHHFIGGRHELTGDLLLEAEKIGTLLPHFDELVNEYLIHSSSNDSFVPRKVLRYIVCSQDYNDGLNSVFGPSFRHKMLLPKFDRLDSSLQHGIKIKLRKYSAFYGYVTLETLQSNPLARLRQRYVPSFQSKKSLLFEIKKLASGEIINQRMVTRGGQVYEFGKRLAKISSFPKRRRYRSELYSCVFEDSHLWLVDRFKDEAEEIEKVSLARLDVDEGKKDMFRGVALSDEFLVVNWISGSYSQCQVYCIEAHPQYKLVQRETTEGFWHLSCSHFLVCYENRRQVIKDARTGRIVTVVDLNLFNPSLPAFDDHLVTPCGKWSVLKREQIAKKRFVETPNFIVRWCSEKVLVFDKLTLYAEGTMVNRHIHIEACVVDSSEDGNRLVVVCKIDRFNYCSYTYRLPSFEPLGMEVSKELTGFVDFSWYDAVKGVRHCFNVNDKRVLCFDDDFIEEI